MRRRGWTVTAAMLWALLLALLCACTMSIGVDPSKVAGVGGAVSAAGEATGNPLLILLGQLLTGGAAVFASVKAAKASDNAPLTPEQAAHAEAALRARGALPPKGPM